MDDTGRTPVWIAALDKSAPPRRLANIESGRPVFGPSGDVFFVEREQLHRIRPDGTGRQQVRSDPVRAVYSISADEKWAALWIGLAVVIAPLEGGSAVELCSVCGTIGAELRGITPAIVSWSRDGKYLEGCSNPGLVSRPPRRRVEARVGG
jgi:hypothetical protein